MIFRNEPCLHTALGPPPHLGCTNYSHHDLLHNINNLNILGGVTTSHRLRGIIVDKVSVSVEVRTIKTAIPTNFRLGTETPFIEYFKLNLRSINSSFIDCFKESVFN